MHLPSLRTALLALASLVLAGAACEPTARRAPDAPPDAAAATRPTRQEERLRNLL